MTANRIESRFMLVILAMALLALPVAAKEDASGGRASKTCPANGKLKIFILAGQSNMVGFGQLTGSPGTMESYLKSNPKDYGHLVDDNGENVVRDDVGIVNLSYKDKERQGRLTTGYGASEEHIGPEYAFGFVMGDYYKDPVLLIKSAWGGRSLHSNFLSPSSKDYPTPKADGDTGFQYAEVLRHVKEITGNLKKYYPDYAGQGFEIVGMGWHQGWNDRINQAAVDAYETNMVNFIKDIRKDLGIKHLPFVIANTGMGGWDIPSTASYKAKVEKHMAAQLAPADPEKYPEFKGNVSGVETRDFQRTREESPSRQDYHWFRNWETLYLIGKGMGDSMVSLLSGDAAAATKQPVAAKEIPKQLPDPDSKPPSNNKPVKVYIMSGQSNMVGIGQVSGGTSRWGKQIIDPVVSVYSGAYSPTVDYDKIKPIVTKKLPVYGGTKPTPFPGGGTQVVRGFIEMEKTGVYKFNPGYSASSHNIMEVDGVEVFRKEVGKEPAHVAFKFVAGEKYPFKITFLTEAANGLGWFWKTDIPGTLNTVVKVDKKFPHLVDDKGNWTARNDVWYKGVVTATADKWLTIGCGAGASSIGPELQFGHIMGYYHDEPVIIIKASQGNRSLAWDILPPNSKRYSVDGITYAGYKDGDSSWSDDDSYKDIEVWYAGKQYDDFVRETHAVLDNFETHFPQFKNQGYEIAGFAWWQGHKDGNPAHASRYETNLVNLIKAYRAEFKAPNAPFVIATIGFNGWDMKGPHLTVAKAQLAVSGEKGKYPEFAGNVLTVETRDFWKDASVSPRNQDFHYNGNAETYLNVGDALGRSMVKLLNAQ